MIVAGEKWHGMPEISWSDQWPSLVHIRHIWPYWRGTRFWEAYWQLLQFPYVLFRCIQLVLWYRITAIVVIGSCSQILLAAYLTSLLTGRRLYPYFHNTYYENTHGWRRRWAGRLQSRLFRRATHVFVMSEGMAELYRERYPGLPQSPLVHSFNGPIPAFKEPPCPESPMQLYMIGSMSAVCSEAAVRLGEAVGCCPDTHLTLLTATGRRSLEQLGLVGSHISCETIPADKVVRRLASADIVLLPHGLTGELVPEEYQTIFPTRTIEYLLCGRPILAHSTAGSFITRFLIENQCALVVDQPDVNMLREAIERLRTDKELRSRLVRNALRTAEQFQASRVAEEFRRRLV